MEEAALYQDLAWYIKLIRFLTRRKKLKAQEVKELKVKKRAAIEEKILTLEQKWQEKEIRKLAVQRLKRELSKDSKRKASRSSIALVHSEEKTRESPEKNETAISDEDTKRLVKKIIEILDEAWQAKTCPNRIYLLERLEEIESEDKLIFFMKKHCPSKVYSFFIKIDRPEYVWPILISHRYLQRNGQKMLNDIRNEMKAQREAFMPDQEKYDELSFIETFLERVLPKISS